MKTITAQQIKQKMDTNQDFVLVNVLSEESFARHHVPGSITIPVDQIEERAAAELPDKNREIIVYCANLGCQASPTAAKKLEAMGYTNVADFEEGLQGWKDAGYAFEGSEG